MRKIWITVIASLAVHSAPLLVLARFPGALSARSPSPPPLAEPVDRWSGNTAELGGGPIYDVSVDPPGGAPPAANAPAIPAPAPQPAPQPAPAPKPAPDPPKDAPPIDVAPKPKPPPPKPRKHVEPAPSASAAASADADEQATHRSPGKKPRPAASGDPGESGGGSAGGGSFGAEGPGAVRDLGRAFTRAIPPACQGDLAWSKLPPGDAGALEFTINIDETGHITGWKPAEGEAPRQLVALVKRTLPLLEAGTFGLRPGAVSAGAEVLRIRATLSDVDADEPGGAAKLSHEYERGKGKAGFTLTGGRHVEVTVQLVKVTEGG